MFVLHWLSATLLNRSRSSETRAGLITAAKIPKSPETAKLFRDLFRFYTILIDKHLKILDRTRGALFGTREVVEGGNGLLATKIDDYQMRQGGCLGCTPVGGLLKVENLIGCEVTTKDILAVSIFHHPWLTREAVALSIADVELGDGSIGGSCMGRADLNSHEPSFYRRIQTNSLPAITRGELGNDCRCGRIKIGFVARVVMCTRFFDIQFIEFGGVDTVETRRQGSDPCLLNLA